MPPSQSRVPIVVPIVVPPEDAEILPVSNIDYTPLQNPTESIRLLRIHTLEEYQNRHIFYFFQPLYCSMVEVKLCDKPAYDALSYVWGDPRTVFPSPRDEHPTLRWRSRPFTIFCDGKPLSVGCNLWVFLLTLRWAKSGFSSRRGTSISDYIWIDAICINQSDLNERSAQVLQMSRIYEQARAVQVWLGGEDSLTDSGIYVLDGLGKHFVGLDLSYRDMSRVDYSKLHLNVRGEQRVMCQKDWEGLVALVSRSWFKRAWIFQEACLATTIAFWIGPYVLPGGEFLRLLRILFESPFEYQIASKMSSATIPADSKGKKSDSIMKEDALRLHFSKDGGIFDSNAFGLIYQYNTRSRDLKCLSPTEDYIPPLTLCEVLMLCRSSLATDPRDKVLAFLSLCAEYQLGRRLRKRLERLVDYNRTPADIYTETTRIILISMSGDLTLLQYKEPFPKHDLPSWALDFSVPWHGLQHIVRGSGNYHCSKPLDQRRMAFSTPFKLVLQGVQVSKIRSLIPMDRWIHVDFLYNALGLLKQLPEKTRVTYPRQLGEEISWQPTFEVLWRTLLGDYFEKQHPAPADVGLKLISYYRLDWLHSAICLLLRAFPELLTLLIRVNTEIGDYLAQTRCGDGILREELSSELDKIAKVYTVWRTLSSPGTKFADELIYPPELEILKSAAAAAIEPQQRVFMTGVTKQIFEFVLFGLSEHSARKDDPSIPELLKVLKARSRCRQLGTTDNGYLGIFPGSSQVGDNVCVVAGARLPFVLRGPDDGSYRLLGDAYVHGIMHGEAVSETITLEELCLS